MTPYHVMMLDQVAKRAYEFDVFHFHIDHLHYPLMRPYADRFLTTLHGRLDLPDLMPFYSAFPEPPLVSISDAQRRPMPPVNWLGTVLHGLPNNVLPYKNPSSGDYFAFLGRISPEKGTDKAIEIATRSGVPLRMAAKIDAADQRYWDQVIAPMVAAHPSVEFVCEINEVQKAEFLGNARALLFPICWLEPFDLVMIEAMACGTPVIALAHGSVPEVIDHGVSGFVVNSVDEAVEAAKSIGTLDRQMIRKRFEESFTAERMARDYLAAYRRLPALRQKAQLDVFAVPSCDGVIRMPPPPAGLELGVATAG